MYMTDKNYTVTINIMFLPSARAQGDLLSSEKLLVFNRFPLQFGNFFTKFRRLRIHTQSSSVQPAFLCRVHGVFSSQHRSHFKPTWKRMPWQFRQVERTTFMVSRTKESTLLAMLPHFLAGKNEIFYDSKSLVIICYHIDAYLIQR